MDHFAINQHVMPCRRSAYHVALLSTTNLNGSTTVDWRRGWSKINFIPKVKPLERPRLAQLDRVPSSLSPELRLPVICFRWAIQLKIEMLGCFKQATAYHWSIVENHRKHTRRVFNQSNTLITSCWSGPLDWFQYHSHGSSNHVDAHGRLENPLDCVSVCSTRAPKHSRHLALLKALAVPNLWHLSAGKVCPQS